MYIHSQPPALEHAYRDELEAETQPPDTEPSIQTFDIDITN